MRKKLVICFSLLIAVLFTSGSIMGQTSNVGTETAKTKERREKSNLEQEKNAQEWVASLDLNDEAKEERLQDVIVTHLITIRDWHNQHPYTTVPAGINPLDGKPLSELDRQIIANSAMPDSVHENLMDGLRKDLQEEKVNAILDKYTIGKVDFTMGGYHAIVPDLTEKEEEKIRGYMEEAREIAVDFKSMDQISGIFEIYKTKSEQYLNSNGRNWRELYKAFVKKVQAEKKAKNNEQN